MSAPLFSGSGKCPTTRFTEGQMSGGKCPGSNVLNSYRLARSKLDPGLPMPADLLRVTKTAAIRIVRLSTSARCRVRRTPVRRHPPAGPAETPQQSPPSARSSVSLSPSFDARARSSALSAGARRDATVVRGGILNEAPTSNRFRLSRVSVWP